MVSRSFIIYIYRQIKHYITVDQIINNICFVGNELNATSKELVLSQKSKSRVRGYFYKAKDEIKKSKLYQTNTKARKLFDNLLNVFNLFLTEVDYFGCLFDRKYPKKHKMWNNNECNQLEKRKESKKDVVDEDDDDDDDCVDSKKQKLSEETSNEILEIFDDVCIALCSAEGDFKCQGLWNKNYCIYKNHFINPYASRENLLLFQIWNWDHQIEITRTVIPSIIDNVKNLTNNNVKCPDHKMIGQHLTVIKYFLELFTIDNLKLVHIICHDKSIHNLCSDGGVICEKCDEFKLIESLLKKC